MASKPTAAAKRRATALRKRQQAAFLSSLERDHLVSEAAKQAGVHRQRAYEWRQDDEEFAQAWAEIEERSTELLEREAYRRAAVGTEKPVFQGGVEVGRIKEFSDVLLIFLLKARRPSTYREQHKIEHTGALAVATAEILTADSKEVADAAHDFLSRIAGTDA